ncbi:hypothetical protein O181_117155 [Austropuccinia psidii MF-1]|uniref:Uncharacterized protein n=1 Tax=Austropuccinia psidii MF-1 TaxID=1389203 RepID=A0A9Q3K9T6_9BASI|nr:hypothetical protein [Austropuccinia psidii MF-1]
MRRRKSPTLHKIHPHSSTVSDPPETVLINPFPCSPYHFRPVESTSDVCHPLEHLFNKLCGSCFHWRAHCLHINEITNLTLHAPLPSQTRDSGLPCTA